MSHEESMKMKNRWCRHIIRKGDTWHLEYFERKDPLISHQVTIYDWEKFCRVCGKERPSEM